MIPQNSYHSPPKDHAFRQKYPKFFIPILAGVILIATGICIVGIWS